MEKFNYDKTLSKRQKELLDDYIKRSLMTEIEGKEFERKESDEGTEKIINNFCSLFKPGYSYEVE